MNKYKNKKVEYEGVVFDSEMELNYYLHLLTIYPSDRIKLQPSYLLIEPFRDLDGKLVRGTTYKADFGILDEARKDIIEVIDVKGFVTADFKIKAKLFKSIYKKKLFLITANPKKYGGGWIEIEELNKLRRKK